MVTVADVMKLPSMYGATILAGKAGLSNPVESITVLEYGQLTDTLDELFLGTEFQGNELLITSFATITDDVDAQIENIRRFHSVGCVGLILFYVGRILSVVDKRVIDCCNSLDMVLISMPDDLRAHKYSDVLADVYHAVFRDQQSGTHYTSTLMRRFSTLPSEQRNIETLLRMLSNHLQISVMLTDYKKVINNIVCWPPSLSEMQGKILQKQLVEMDDVQITKITMCDGTGYLQHCPTLLENIDGFELYTFKYNEPLSREALWQVSETVQLYSHIWNKDLGKFVTSELVRAIIDDDSLKMSRLAELFHISVSELNQMWVFESTGRSEPNLHLLQMCTEYFSNVYETVLTGYYESNIIAFTCAPQNASERDAIAQGFVEYLGFSYGDYRMICCDCLRDTEDVHNAYFDAVNYARYAECIYSKKTFLRSADIAFAKMCVRERNDRHSQLLYLKIIKELEDAPELLNTLTSYLLDCDSSMVATAKAMCCHLNTVKYRLNAIRDRIGYAPSKPVEVYPLLIAVAINRLKNIGD